MPIPLLTETTSFLNFRAKRHSRPLTLSSNVLFHRRSIYNNNKHRIMIPRRAFHDIRQAARRRPQPAPPVQSIPQRRVRSIHQLRARPRQQWSPRIFCAYPSHAFHTSRTLHAQPPTADALMENLNDLYSTARDEFEIAAEETEGKTIYAADDREAAKEAFAVLKEAYE